MIFSDGIFSKLFPISMQERKKFFLLACLMCAILFINHLLWDIKNTLIVQTAGAEALSLLKLIGTPPTALLFMCIYSKMSRHVAQNRLFIYILTFFLLFFILFAFIFYPCRSALHPSSEWVEQLSSLYPRYQTFFQLVGNWSYALFYVLAELWPSITLSLLFWQLANEIVAIDEAKRFYPLFGLLANVAIIVAGIVIYSFSKAPTTHIDPWKYTIQSLMIIIVLMGSVIFTLHRKLLNSTSATARQKDDQLLSLSFKESLRHLLRSRQLGLIALFVIGYGLAQKIMEGLWQDQVKTLYPSFNSYSSFMGQMSWISGICTFALMFIATLLMNQLRAPQFGWYLFASGIILATGLFFFFVIFHSELSPLVAIWIGSFQDVLNKVTKSSFCDPVKEMSYIPLDKEVKIKGKAAVDVVGERLGKHGGAFVQQFFLLTTASTLSGIAPYLAPVCLAALTLWICAIFLLRKEQVLLDERKYFNYNL